MVVDRPESRHEPVGRVLYGSVRFSLIIPRSAAAGPQPMETGFCPYNAGSIPQ